MWLFILTFLLLLVLLLIFVDEILDLVFFLLLLYYLPFAFLLCWPFFCLFLDFKCYVLFLFLQVF